MIRLGVVAAGPAVRIADGTQASAGDLILAELAGLDPGDVLAAAVAAVQGADEAGSGCRAAQTLTFITGSGKLPDDSCPHTGPLQ
jgi:hypothetical protein